MWFCVRPSNCFPNDLVNSSDICNCPTSTYYNLHTFWSLRPSGNWQYYFDTYSQEQWQLFDLHVCTDIPPACGPQLMSWHCCIKWCSFPPLSYHHLPIITCIFNPTNALQLTLHFISTKLGTVKVAFTNHENYSNKKLPNESWFSGHKPASKETSQRKARNALQCIIVLV